MRNSLKVLRAQNDWSQAELAEHLGVSRQTVNAVETGKYDPSLPLAFRIAGLFDRRIEDVFEPFEAERAPQSSPVTAAPTLGRKTDVERIVVAGPGADTS